MNKKEKISYTAPLTGVEEQNESAETSVHDALQTTWDTEQIIKLEQCEQAEEDE
ncbi:hypothetical protein JCM9140_4567 [Halalkalibacter wakoensis JCM 9140]|uniref:Uncharacterized protein n=1 Tax=Halalkalibacter wakoensis JCM 9140 TaxID=1236970 RepID=W4Q8P1_9BACI|nr:hypothetical protein [Halalkalibacter wakoensis]GAE28347.1 hypothetical protein JCM9140_4567 [Halalkalibacter wakoensis JCM 9140]